MTGPEHYMRGEELLAEARLAACPEERPPGNHGMAMYGKAAALAAMATAEFAAASASAALSSSVWRDPGGDWRDAHPGGLRTS